MCSIWNIFWAGWFGPLIQLTAEEQAAQTEQERQRKLASVHSYREPSTGSTAPTSKRPSLIKRLSSAVELSSWSSPPKKNTQDMQQVTKS
jgi:hypothetical protein